MATDQTVLTEDGISFTVTQGPFTGSTRRLLRQINRISTTTDESQRDVGVSAAFVVDDTGSISSSSASGSGSS
ncbi:hypothetical protein [Mumia zhuanghuii]|uniref:Uncharacterized protein n=1 Tax=Mumia zhuanghuii TaxID=2585211 RepID=A0A5C4N133_9ACTN|nr:hypothetical protein [Mumia zhuanghuii]TNC44629.1 hypothetical protein FHE65_16380 [Mumia zhuanghuii]TNC51055.1 hypothetical protein FHE65_02475 [Mumia zhuanghuii]